MPKSNIEAILWIALIVIVVGSVGAGVGVLASDAYEAGDYEDMSTWAMIWQGLGFFISMLTFQVPEVPPIVNSLVAFPIYAVLIYMIIKIARGGG